MSVVKSKMFTENKSVKKINEWAYVFHSLGDKIRLNIISEIVRKPGISAKEMLIDLKLSQPTLSFHLKQLQKSKIIFYKKDGTTHSYYINVPTIIKYYKDVEEACNYFYKQVVPTLKKK